MHALLGPWPPIGRAEPRALGTFDAEIQSCVHAFRNARHPHAVGQLLADATRALGFDHYALMPRLCATGTAAMISNYPAGWLQKLQAQDGWLHDPVLAASRTRGVPFDWAELADIIRLTPNQQKFMQRAAAHGLSGGWTTPFHPPGEAGSACSFVVANGRELPRHNLPAAQHLAVFALEALRRLPDEASPRARLTKRQVECAILAGRGKSDWVAARILGLAPDTVHKYLEQAKARYGVSSRTELVVRALHNGQISFDDLLD